MSHWINPQATSFKRWSAMAMGMMSVPLGEDADAIKSQYKVWTRIKCSRLGTDRCLSCSIQ
jgi:hypothetical protein